MIDFNNNKKPKQAAKTLQLTLINKEYKVKVSLHKTLNFSVGEVHTNEFHRISESEIIDLLRSQGLTEVKKLKKALLHPKGKRSSYNYI